MAYETSVVTCTNEVWTEILSQGDTIRIEPQKTFYEIVIGSYPLTLVGDPQGFLVGPHEPFEYTSIPTSAGAAVNMGAYIKPKGKDITVVLIKNDQGAG